MKKRKGNLKWIWPFFKPYRATLVLVFIIAILSTALQLSYPYLSKIFIDDVLLQPTYSLKGILWLTFSLSLLAIVTQLVNSYIYLKVTLQMIKNLRLYLFNHIERLKHSFFVRTPIGEITTRLSGDINIVHGTLTDGVLQLCMAILTLVFITTMLIILNWKLFILTLFVFPLFIITLFYFRPLITNKTRELREDQSSIQGHMIETFTRIRLVKLFTAEREQEDKLGEKIDQLNKHSLQYAIIESVAGGIPQALTLGMTTIILFLGGSMVLNETMTIGSLLAFTAYLGRFFSPVQTLAGLYIRFQNMNVSLHRLTDYLQLPTEDAEATHTLRIDSAQPVCVTYKNVSKRHQERVLYDDVSLMFEGGRAYGIVGPSGTGKSTFVDLLVKIQEADVGTITIQHQSIEQLHVQSLRRHVCVVPQEVEIFNESVRDNLLFGLTVEEKEQMTDEQIEHICRQIGLHDDVMQMQEGYETSVGEAGKRLSGGQRQRLSIARALLRNPNILILDEATSGSDYHIERELFEHLRQWLNEREDRLLLIISHRLESMNWFDRWIVMNRGTVTEVAHYDEMIHQFEQLQREEGPWNDAERNARRVIRRPNG